MKLKKAILFALFVALLFPVSAQVVEVEDALKKQSEATEDGWRTGGVTSLNFSQLYLSNWAAGGANSYSLNGLVSLFASYKKDKLTWDNSLDMGYGVLHQKDLAYSKKTDDKFDLLSKVGYKAFDHVYYTGLLNFKTQFANGYDYKDPLNRVKISNLLAPAYLIGAIGLDYKPTNYFSAFFAPITSRFVIVGDKELSDAGAYGVEKGKTVKTEFGAYLRTIFTKNDFEPAILKNVTLTSKLDLFSNYLHKPQNIDINWELLIALKINDYLSVNINTNLIYDDDVKFGEKQQPKIQFKELLGVGFSYKF